MSLLEKISSPADLRRLDPDELPGLAEEIRALIIETVSRNGGHLASNLGAVELTIALLRVFDPPEDKLLFDVSHQAYTYKLLTGRRADFATLRQTDGISGFLKRSESPYDVFGAGHGGTAISAGLGFAVERDRRGGSESVVAVVGDAALANGMSLEALNNVADATRRFIVVLNDNNMAISRNVGALSHAFGRLLGNPRYNRVKSAIEEVGIRYLRLSWLRRSYHALERTLKSTLLPNSPFETMGIRYIGPINGHNIRQVEAALESAREAKCPVLLHVSTQKGRGYPFAVQHPENWHASNPFDIATGAKTCSAGGTSWSTAFGRALAALADADPRITAITAAMASGTGLDIFAKAHPDRFHDVGICESHQMTFAAGLATAGLRPVVAVYSTFFQRAIDGLVHDIALQNLPVVVCLDRAGVVPGDGPTHHGIFDIAMMRPIPGLVIMQPRTCADLARMLRTALALDGPAAIRYPRGSCACDEADDGATIPVGRAAVLETVRPDGAAPDAPCPVAIWTLGPEDGFSKAVAARLAARGIGSIRVDARFAKPIDADLLLEQAASGVKVFLTVEDGIANGGFGSAVEALFAARPDARPAVIALGWPDAFVPHATSRADLLALCNLTPDHAAERVLAALPATRAKQP
ncbi:MAG: 1-deoxy-D-xylulose-5-phosphate synthase [Kiritimatiellia bacterium]|jgi:1-deoxy-D-xylulose-5-phosphate synthase